MLKWMAAEPQEKPTVLIIDDDFGTRLQLRAVLEKAGMRVEEAENGEDGLRLFEAQPPEVVILDVVMPGMDGFETCRRLRRLPGGDHLPVMMLTGLDDLESIHQAFEAGATDFIAKPINWTILGYRIHYMLRSGTVLKDLVRSRQRLAQAQRIACLGHWELDLENGRFGFATELPGRLGIRNPERYGSLFEMILPEDRERVRHEIDEACRLGRSFNVHYRVCCGTEERTLHNQGEVIFDEHRRSHLMVGIIQDISELKKAEEKIRYLAFYDSLTGLANRALFREHWASALAHARRRKSRIAILFLDLDHFKQVNDTLGHPSGDRLLKIVSERLEGIVRDTDIVCHGPTLESGASLVSRMGGDEFTILVSDIQNQDHIAGLACRIMQVLCRPVVIDDQEVSITASMGISVFPNDGEDIDALIKNADTAMYEAKSRGRNNFQFFEKEMNDAAIVRFRMVNSIRGALNQRQFVLHYQPQFSIKKGLSVNSVEALIRWEDPEKGLVLPADFLSFAEESGLIHEINEWVIDAVCRQAVLWQSAFGWRGFRVTVNISGQDLDLERMFYVVTRALETSGLDPRCLELELTERVMMANTRASVKVLRRMQEQGISIAIDDFGTGYSALSHLQIFPLDTLKIDKSFVNNITLGERHMSLLKSIIGIAKSFELKVVAEGVEKTEQLRLLKSLGVDEVQGFLLSPGLSSQDLEAAIVSGKLRMR